MDIQNQILTKLTRSNGLRFSELQPRDITSDKFSYHLKQLTKKKYLAKNRERYFLTKRGKELVADIKPIDIHGQEQHMFKVNVLIFAQRINPDTNVEEILFKTRSREPFKGFMTIPGGNIGRGESIPAAAYRHLLEKTGLTANFTTFGTMRKIHIDTKTNATIVDILFYFAKAENLSGELDSSLVEEHYWLPLKDAFNYLKLNPQLPHKISAIELKEILNAIASNSFYFNEVEMQVKDF